MLNFLKSFMKMLLRPKETTIKKKRKKEKKREALKRGEIKGLNFRI